MWVRNLNLNRKEILKVYQVARKKKKVPITMSLNLMVFLVSGATTPPQFTKAKTVKEQKNMKTDSIVTIPAPGPGYKLYSNMKILLR